MIFKLKKHQDGIPYIMASREVIQSIKDSNALAIWVYLQTKPDNWTPRRSELMEQFKLGRARYDNAIKCLKSLGLYEVEQIRNEKGIIRENIIHIYPNLPDGRKTHKSVNPQVGKPTMRENRPLKEKEIIKEEEIVKEKENKTLCEVKTSPEDEVFNFWKSTLNHPRAKLDPKKKKIISSTLKIGYSVDDCKQAIIGCSKTPFNMGQNDRHKKFDAIHTIFKSENIDGFIETAETPNQNIVPFQQQRQKTFREIEDEWNDEQNRLFLMED